MLLGNCKACCLSRCNHSIKSKIIPRHKYVTPYSIDVSKNLFETIADKYSKACVIVSARKIIQPMTARKNVNAICNASFMLGI